MLLGKELKSSEGVTEGLRVEEAGRIRAPPTGKICLGKPSLGAFNPRTHSQPHPRSTGEVRGFAIFPPSLISLKDNHPIEIVLKRASRARCHAFKIIVILNNSN